MAGGPQSFRELAREAGRQMPGEVAPWLARAVRAVPPARLEQAMRSPLRRIVLDALFFGLPLALDETGAGELVSALHFRVTGQPGGGCDAYRLALLDGHWQARRGDSADTADLEITVDGAELLSLACGRSNPVQAYMSGRLRVRGDLLLAARLATLVRRPPSAA